MSVSNIFEKLGVSDKFAKSVQASSKAKSISTALVVMRHKAGLTQADVAIKMNVSQSKIAKIERCLNSDLRMRDIEAYVWAVGGSLNIATRGKEGSFVVCGDMIRLIPEQDAKDASRYRWLRAQHWIEGTVSVVSAKNVFPGSDCPSYRRLDEWIDSMMLDTPASLPTPEASN